MGCDIHVVAEVRKNGVWELSPVKIPDGRNYCTFGILANVRNGHGFAGFDTGDALPYISLPRGLPEDMSRELSEKLAHAYDNEDDFFWLGDHSFSWVTLREMLEYPYDGNMATRGMVPAEVAAKFRETGEAPQEWCAWTNQEGYESLEWQRALKDAAWLFGELLEVLSKLGEPDDVRIVFGFDS